MNKEFKNQKKSKTKKNHNLPITDSINRSRSRNEG